MGEGDEDRLDPITLAVLALGSVVILGGGKKRRRAPSGVRAVIGEEDRRYWLNEIRNMSEWASREFGMMPNLANFLTVIGFRESNFNPAIANPEIKTNPMNASRGLFGERPRTAFKKANGLEHLRQQPNLLLDPTWAFVMAVDHIYRAYRAVVREGSGMPDWLAARRWWALPYLVHDFDEGYTESEDIRERLEEATFDVNAAYGTNIDPDFIWRPIEAEGYPGIEVMLASFGLEQKAVA